jgi:uncharacterized paraquat-inducible protein A
MTAMPHDVTCVRCRRCGAVLDAAAIDAERVLVFAACCPRCDGLLEPVSRRSLRRRGAPAPRARPPRVAGSARSIATLRAGRAR